MVCSATTVREENRDTACVDGHPEEGISPTQDVTADRSIPTAGDVTAVSAAEVSDDEANETEAVLKIGPSEVVIRDLWFALSRQEQLQFGAQFSRMLLRAVDLQVTSPIDESESNS